MANTAEHKAAERSLSDYLGIAIPLPHVAQKSLEWALKSGDLAKYELTRKLLGILYRNDNKSYEIKVREAFEGFNFIKKG